MSKKQIFYSDKYNDDEFEYRHVVLPRQLSKLVPSSHLMTEDEWRGLGVQQSQGWMHYMVHKPGVPSFPKRVIFASTRYRGPGLESTESTAIKKKTFRTGTGVTSIRVSPSDTVYSASPHRPGGKKRACLLQARNRRAVLAP
ncbi:hypothetical protein ILYODFUR_034480 [Ilyodon furcidens]|uniref:Cyclin-dependent kinases regulatory subunit n=1 Tax=Ilyodon furcidens TaxID=33524 RepID=A0ABV0VJX6_9TELE